jgi:hypothetical protein
MLEESRDAVAAGEEQLACYTAEQRKYSLFVQQPFALAAISLSRVMIACVVFAAALPQV